MRTRFVATAVAVLMALPAGAVAVPGLSPDAAETFSAARARAAITASELLAQASEATDDVASEDEGRGQDPNKTTGLARAAEVSNSWRFTGEEKPGNGRGMGVGSARSRAVHAALAAGTSPSEITDEDLDAAAAELAGAFNSFRSKRDGHPGKGQGKGLGGPGGPDSEDPTDD